MVDQVVSGDQQDEPLLPAQHWEAALAGVEHVAVVCDDDLRADGDGGGLPTFLSSSLSPNRPKTEGALKLPGRGGGPTARVQASATTTPGVFPSRVRNRR